MKICIVRVHFSGVVQVVALGSDATFVFAHNLLLEDIASVGNALLIFVAAGAVWRGKVVDYQLVFDGVLLD
jgi:hypothetical protein